MKLARALTLALAGAVFVALGWMLARRVAHPYDLEWLEGMTLWHAQRLVDGQAIYPAPTLDFVPLPYTPLYPALLALFGKVFGVSYALGRVLSIGSFAAALAIGWRFVRGAGGSRALATAAMAIPCAAWAPTGAWIDLVRVDSLSLLLIALGTTLAFRATMRSTIASAIVLVAAFFAKQTAAPFMIATAIALAVGDRRRAVAFGATLAIVGLPSLWLAQHATDHWFWFYVYKIHHSHKFDLAGCVRTPGRLALLLAPAVPLVAWALRRDRSPSLRWAAWLAATAIVGSSVAKATAGAYLNAYLPAVYFSALFVGVAAARLLDGADTRRGAIVWSLVGATLLVAPGGIPLAIYRVRPSTYHGRPMADYDPRPYVPTATDRDRAARFLDRVRATPGDVWLASRPWYARLAGKRPLAGEMAASDLLPTGVAIDGFADAMAARRFTAIVLDDPHDPSVDRLRFVTRDERIDGPGDRSGLRVVRLWLTPLR